MSQILSRRGGLELVRPDQLSRIESMGYKLLAAYKRWRNTYVVVEDKDGYKYCAYIDHLIKNHKSIVGKNNPHSLENIANWLKLNNKSFELCDGNVYRDNNTKLKCYCRKCGETFQFEWRCFSVERDCPRCHYTKGESEIKEYLERRGIAFAREQPMLNCKNKKHLRFDFFLPDFNLCIEYNGGQHYKSVDGWGGEGKLQYVIQMDKIKADYCRDNGIRLLVIPYWEFNNIPSILGRALVHEQSSDQPETTPENKS